VIARRVDLGVVVAFGRLLSQALLDVVPVVNLHLSLLPRWRGAAPVERAILAGDLETGVSIMALEAGLDTGPVYVAIATQIDPEESATTLGHRLVALGTDELCTRLAGGIAGLGTPHPQVGVPTYAAKISADDRRLDFSADAIACHRVVRIGRATTTFRDAPFTVHRAAVTAGAPGGTRVGELVGDVVATASGGLRLLEVQVPGRRPQPFAEFARGARIAPGEVLGDPGTDRLPSSGLGGQG
jgi:methionyl-tRNA formyltransferase